jgi:cation diffusion facilitator family transporter
MHEQSLERWQHRHVFLGAEHARNERKTWVVIGLTATMMVGEIVGGGLFGSMALIADGLHMSTHAGALLIAALAYALARRHAQDPRFAFGTGKFGDLAAFTSAIVLAMIALLIGYEAATRLIAPVPIAFREAIPVAALGLVVNLASAWLLHDGEHGHSHAHDHDHEHEAQEHHDHDDHDQDHHDHDHHDHHAQRDHNLRAAYIHVLADAATSVMAIFGLSLGWIFGWLWMDAIMGILGALVIANWSYGLVRAAGGVLLDVIPGSELPRRIRAELERDGDRIADLHLWRVGPGHVGAIVSLVTHHPQPPAHYKARLSGVPTLAHVTIEVESCA